MMSPEEHNMELMQTLDDAWNAQDLDIFSQRHKPDVVVRWPGKPPTHGIEAHRAEAIEFFTAFPDQRVGNRPYKVFFASGDWTCSVARFTGTMTGPMQGPDGKEIPLPASRSTWTSAPSLAGTVGRLWRRISFTILSPSCGSLVSPAERPSCRCPAGARLIERKKRSFWRSEEEVCHESRSAWDETFRTR
jgi:hypothetical protein